jgi:hypothetical protein
VDVGAKLCEGEASTLGGINQPDGGIPAARPNLPRGIELHNIQIELLDKQSKLNGASKIRTPHGHASAPTKKCRSEPSHPVHTSLLPTETEGERWRYHKMHSQCHLEAHRKRSAGTPPSHGGRTTAPTFSLFQPVRGGVMLLVTKRSKCTLGCAASKLHLLSPPILFPSRICITHWRWLHYATVPTVHAFCICMVICIAHWAQPKVQGKLEPRFIGPFKILEKRGEVAYQLELPLQLSDVHDMFHVSQLKKCLCVPEEQIPMEDTYANDLSYQEYPIKILETSERVTRNKKIKMCKVQWSHHTEEEAT